MSQLERGDIFAGSYELLDHIGSGGFAEVWKARYKLGNFDGSGDDVIVAIKIYAPGDGLDQDGIRIFQREYAKTNTLNHNHLLKAQHFDIYGGSPYLVLPYCAEGSLMSQIIRGGKYAENDVALIMQQISSGLSYLHKKHIAHQDIKPANILVREKRDYVISDFGISTKVRKTIALSGNDAQEANHSAFAPAYAPPERYTSRPKPSGDIFALGVSLYEVCDGDTPFDDTGEAIKQGGSIPHLSSFSGGLNQILRDCTALDPEARPTAEQLETYANYYLQNGHWPSEKKKKKSPVLMYLLGAVASVAIAIGAYFAFMPDGVPTTPAVDPQVLVDNEYKELVKKGDEARDKKDIKTAMGFYTEALNKKPDGAEASVPKKSCEATMTQFNELVKEAEESAKSSKTSKLNKAKSKYDEAMALVCCTGYESRVETINNKIAANNKPKLKYEKDVSKILAAAADKIESKQWKAARDLFVKARQENPKRCCRGKETPFEELGKKMKKAGHDGRAIQYFNYAKDVNPSFVIPQR